MADFSKFFGWFPTQPKDYEAFCSRLPLPYFSDVNHIKGTAKGKTVLLYEYVRQLNNGKDILTTQVGSDCTAHGAACAIGHASAADICYRQEWEEWCGPIATEPIYGGSRVNVGGGRLGNSLGSYGSWTAEFCQKYAIVPRGKYGKYDLTEYNWNTAQSWGSPGRGCPVELLNSNKGRHIQAVSQVRTSEEVADAIANGIGITIASNTAWTTKRNQYGACRVDPNNSWPHQLSIIAMIFTDELQMFCIANSWGNYLSGPLYLNQPTGSFWCYADELEKYVLSANDSWAYDNVEGFGKRDLSCRIV